MKTMRERIIEFLKSSGASSSIQIIEGCYGEWPWSFIRDTVKDLQDEGIIVRSDDGLFSLPPTETPGQDGHQSRSKCQG